MATNPASFGLGRQWVPDARDAQYPLRAITAPAPERTTPWKLGSVLDQQTSPWCVAFTGREWLNAEPVRDPDQAAPDPATLYAGAQANDGIPGPHDGSNDRGLMKYLQSVGLVDSFHWAESIEDVVQYVRTTGPLLCGTGWHQAMFTPDAHGFVHPDGNVAGGHEYLCYYAVRETQTLSFQQSWGEGWGVPDAAAGAPRGGTFRMTFADFAALLADQGDACAAVKVFPAPAPPATTPATHRWRNPLRDWSIAITRKGSAP